ncbi:hypothetical protein AURDEDRAFT_129133 [Auricularia subglabra TFB-10046 SS5]|uniref:F-box domain-containing protein n=1 Tax=Auricularia subglabra (strain TFB-10046 / SS5) TaxID=717982 RepID=J0D0U2_AURST|nr:hypothetical protein AURDEDRAFT_129133 [Auricularia subglabra TFB-10046 SS5]
MEQLKNAVRASVHALALGALNSEEWSTVSARARYDAMEEALEHTTAEALVPIAVQYNDKRPAVKLPNDLLCGAVAYLPLPDRMKAAQVCSKWRATLTRNPDLWTRVSITALEGDLTHLPDMLTLLFARSQGKALSVVLMLRGVTANGELSADFEPYGAFGHIAELLALQMPRMKALSLILPACFEPHWQALFTTPAPKLETFRLIVETEDKAGELTMPNNLFGCRAPLLRHAYLNWVWLNDEPYPALEGLTSVFYDFARMFNKTELQHFQSWTHLRYLTLVAADPSTEYPTFRLPQPVRLQLWNASGVAGFLESFPHARHICYSAGLAEENMTGTDQERDFAAIADAIAMYTNPVSFEIAYRRPLLTDDDDEMPKGDDETKPRLALRIDRRDVVVDMLSNVLFDVLAHLPPLTVLLQSVRRLAVPEEFYPLFNIHGLPPLDELTLYLSRDDDTEYRTEDYLATDNQRIGMQLHTLRLVRSSEDDPQNRAAPRYIGIAPIVQFVSLKLASGTLDRLVLCGFKATAADLLQLQAGGIQQVVSGYAPGVLEDDDDCGPWRWQFPVEDAVAL